MIKPASWNDLRVQSGVLPLLLIDEQCVICRCEHHVPVRLPGHTTRQRGDRRTVSQNAIKVIRSDANDDCGHGTAVVLLMYFYWSGFIFLLGGEVDATLARLRNRHQLKLANKLLVPQNKSLPKA